MNIPSKHPPSILQSSSPGTMNSIVNPTVPWEIWQSQENSPCPVTCNMAYTQCPTTKYLQKRNLCTLWASAKDCLLIPKLPKGMIGAENERGWDNRRYAHNTWIHCLQISAKSLNWRKFLKELLVLDQDQLQKVIVVTTSRPYRDISHLSQGISLQALWNNPFCSFPTSRSNSSENFSLLTWEAG